MNQISFGPSLLIGVPSIDREHRELITELNRFIGRSAAPLDPAFFSEYLSRLQQQISAHFTNEERFLVFCPMPAEEIDLHIRAHDEILEQYAQLILDMMDHKPLDRSRVISMIREWVVTHVERFDLRIRDYLPEKTPTPA